MLEEQISIGLKEWAVVQRSLLEQHQIILLRKGGIAEETGDFDLRSRQFFIFPTYEHEMERHGDVQECFQKWLDEEDANKPAVDTVKIECVCETIEVISVKDRNKLINLMPQHIWSRQFIDGRYEWEPYKPVFVLILRAYRLSEPILIPMKREYGGCRSWVSLDQPIITAGAQPAIRTHSSFLRRFELTRSLLAEGE